MVEATLLLTLFDVDILPIAVLLNVRRRAALNEAELLRFFQHRHQIPVLRVLSVPVQ